MADPQRTRRGHFPPPLRSAFQPRMTRPPSQTAVYPPGPIFAVAADALGLSADPLALMRTGFQSTIGPLKIRRLQKRLAVGAGYTDRMKRTKEREPTAPIAAFTLERTTPDPK